MNHRIWCDEQGNWWHEIARYPEVVVLDDSDEVRQFIDPERLMYDFTPIGGHP